MMREVGNEKVGNTSAYAEKTNRQFAGPKRLKKHLRLRGENPDGYT